MSDVGVVIVFMCIVFSPVIGFVAGFVIGRETERYNQNKWRPTK